MIHLVRHTQVKGDGLCYGRFEPELMPTFNAEASKLKAHLSPSVHLTFGKWEGKAWLSFRGPESEHWVRNPWDLAPPGGERLRDLWARVREFRQELRQSLNAETETVIVTHAGVMRAWLAQVEGVDWRSSLNRPLAFGQVVSLPTP